MIDSLYFFSLLLLLDSFSLHVSSRYVYSPCCCSCKWQKFYGKKIVFYHPPSHIFQKKKTKIKFFFGRIFLFSFFYSLPFKKSIFANKHLFYQFYRLVSLSLSQKNSSVFWKWISLDFLCFSWLKFFSSFFRHFFFCSSRFAFTSFFISFYVWSLIFLISLLFLNSVFLNSNFSFFE